MDTKLLLKPSEAADELRVSRSKIYELLAANAIPKIKVGSSVRVPREALIEWIAQQRAEK